MSLESMPPGLFALFFIAMWFAVCYLIAALGGWRLLAEQYRLAEPFVGKKWYFRSASFRRFVSYGNALTVGANERGLYLAVLAPFRLGHPPLLIPWQRVQKARRGVFNVLSTPLLLGGPSSVRVCLSTRLVTRFEEILGHELDHAV